MSEEKDLQNRYMQFQMLQQQIEQITQQVEMLNHQTSEIDTSIIAIFEVGKSEVGKELLAPVANGVFVKGEIRDNKKLIVNIGSGVTVEKTVDEVIKLLEEQKVEMASKVLEAEKVLMDLQKQAMKIYEEVEAMQKTEA